MLKRLALTLSCLIVVPILSFAKAHHGWELVDGDGLGTTGARAQDLNLPTDNDGLPIYPTQAMCLADLKDNLKEAEHSTPLIDRDWVAQGDPYGNSKAAHCELENAQRARCAPYAKGKYVSPDGPGYVCPWDK